MRPAPVLCADVLPRPNKRAARRDSHFSHHVANYQIQALISAICNAALGSSLEHCGQIAKISASLAEGFEKLVISGIQIATGNQQFSAA